jgi:DNA-binding SARP family transcriptional activator
MTPTVVRHRTRREARLRRDVGNGSHRPARGGAVRLLHLLASVAIAVFLVVLPPVVPDFGPSIATPLTTSTLVQLALLLLWIVCLVLALVLLRGAVFPTRVLRPPPPWALRPAPRQPRRTPRLVRGEAPAPRLIVARKDDDAPSNEVDQPGSADAVADSDGTIVARVVLLGSVEIEGVRRPRRATTVELLAYLALHEQGASRDELLEAMWPGEDPRRTRPRLYQSVSEARKLLGDDAFERHGDRYQLDRARVTTDVDELNALLRELGTTSSTQASAVADRVLGLWRGTPLAGGDYAWADGHVRQLEGTLAALAERAGRAQLVEGHVREALLLAERGLALDNLNETFVRLALEADARLGQRERVTDRYEDFRRRLDDALGLEPERATRVLYRSLLAQE